MRMLEVSFCNSTLRAKSEKQELVSIETKDKNKK